MCQKSVHTRDLARATTPFRVDCSYRRIFEQILKDEEVTSFNKFEFNSVEVIKQSVVHGLGIAVLPEIAVAEEIRRKRLVVLPWSEGGIEVAILMVWFRERWISPTIRAFMDMTRKIIKQR